MKKIIFKITSLLIFIITMVPYTYAASLNFHNGYISDQIHTLEPIQKVQLNAILKNFQKDTKTDIAIVTLRKLEDKEKFKDIENQIRSEYVFGGESKENWIIVIVTQEPYRMSINVGKDLRRLIPRTMIRALLLDFNLNKLFMRNQEQFNYRSAGRNLYSTVLFLAEPIADKHNVRLHTSAVTEEIIEGIYNREPAMYVRRSDNFTKFVRRHNLMPVIFILLVGISPYIAMHRRRYRRNLFGSFYRRF